MALLRTTLTTSSTGHIADANQIGKKLNALVVDVKADFAATGDGVTDDTAAITSALAAGGQTFFPAGTYIVTGLSLPSGAHLLGVGAGNYGTAAATTQRSIIKLMNAANADVLAIPAGNPYGVLENLEVDANKANQTTGGNGINFADAGAAEECGWELRHVEVHDSFAAGIRVGTNRQALYAAHVLVTNAAQHGVQILGTDSTWFKLMVGSSGFKNIVVQASMTRLIGGECWSGSDYGIVVVSHDIVISGVGVDHQQLGGILLDTGADSVSISGCDFHSNSQATDNTYSDIKLNVAGNYTIVGCSFGALDSGITNKRKYAIESAGNTALATANAHVSAATGTGFTDTLANVLVAPLRRARALTDAATVTPNCDTTEIGTLASLSQSTTIANPTGTPNDGQQLQLRIKSSVARTLTFDTSYRGSTGNALPSATTGSSKNDYLGFAYNATDSKWDLVDKSLGF